MQPDFVIVGSGLTGATLARELADAGQRVEVVERRPCIGGNVADTVHACGLRMNLYGPHYFRTSCDDLWRFVNRFAWFAPYEAVVKSRVQGGIENWPIAASFIRRTIGETWTPEFVGRPRNFEQAALSLMPRAIYEHFVKGYTQKQWGVAPRLLSADLCRRFDVRTDDDPRLTPTKKHQGMPVGGYTKLVERMLQDIPVERDVDYLQDRDAFAPAKMLLFTGPIDAFFNHCFGRLKYRGQRRRTWYAPDCRLKQPCGQVNEPDLRVPIIRTIEWKHMVLPDTAQAVPGTLLTTEEPYTPDHDDALEYPFPDAQNAELYRRYRALAEDDSRVLICGRLGEYRYYDMDQAIARARILARKILETRPWQQRKAQLVAAADGKSFHNPVLTGGAPVPSRA